ncbi:uncharacterized protein BJX67DRAFT_385919 [Aspergillus lucknowensis]|uniref:Uncharacterized protein n=1 Tax=Aspergillus lucknowensis TaxID=176173 RepID=A0ABR4L9F8_9EURO
MSTLPFRVIQSRDIKGAGLARVLNGGTNRVFWNRNRLIWDSLDLIEDFATEENQMAVFGGEGKIELQLCKQFDFQVRYTINFDNQPCYRLHVAITGPTRDAGEEYNKSDFAQSDFLAENEQKIAFRQAIYALTQQVQSMGVEATIRSFMTFNGASSAMTNGEGFFGSGGLLPGMEFKALALRKLA